MNLLINVNISNSFNLVKICILEMNSKPTHVTLHIHWNKSLRRSEIVTAIATSASKFQIDWYKIQEDLQMVIQECKCLKALK